MPRTVTLFECAGCRLMPLRLGHDPTGFRYGGQPRGLASEAEILARFPELASQA